MGDMKALVDGFTPEAGRFIEGRKRATHFIDRLTESMREAVATAIDRGDTAAMASLSMPCGVVIETAADSDGNVDVTYYNDNDWRGHDNVTAAIEEAVLALPDLDDWECRIEKKFQDDEIEKSLFELDYCRSVV